MPEATGGAPGEDPLADLRARIRAAHEAAERLGAETGPRRPPASGEPPGGASNPAAEAAPPPRGWDVPRPAGTGDGAGGELAQLLAALLAALRALVPRELQQPLLDLVRELLLALRAIIDWYLERLDARRPGPVEVEEIPIE